MHHPYRLSFALTSIFTLSCASSSLRPYSPKEVDIKSQAATYQQVRAELVARHLPLLEEEPEKGRVTTAWRKVGKKEFQIEVLISPVSSIVRLRCRIEHALELSECAQPRRFPRDLVRHATELTKRVKQGVSYQAADPNSP